MNSFTTCSAVWIVRLPAGYSRKWQHLCPYCFSCLHLVAICLCLPFGLVKVPVENFDCLGWTVLARTVCECFVPVN